MSDISGYEQAFGTTASSFGNNLWLIVALAVTFTIMVLGVASGIEKANKIMIPLFFLLFMGLAVYVYFQPGASEGYKYMFSINPEKLKDPMMWVYALGQSFFSLSLAGNGTVIYGSYLSDDEDIVSSAWKVACLLYTSRPLRIVCAGKSWRKWGLKLRTYAITKASPGRFQIRR